MKHILVLGAGRSTSYLLQYLIKKVSEYGWRLTVGDYDVESLQSKIPSDDHIKAIQFDIFDEAKTHSHISQADIVISMLPAAYHIHVARACLKFEKSMLTASYVSDEIKALSEEAIQKKVLFLMECGLDPGIDHMSALKVIHDFQKRGYELLNFETFTGGLIAPESEGNNPWRYKFTWNPRNVVLAGQGTVKFVQEGKTKYIPYHKLFRRTEIIEIPGYGFFEGYANRDSLKYQEVYGLSEINTLYRGTLRRPGYCRAWDVFVQIGATDDSYKMEQVNVMTHRDFINSFLSYNPHDSVELKLAHYLQLDLEGDIMHKLKWLGVFENEPVGLKEGTPAQILEHILKKKWTISAADKDMIVMWHKFDFIKEGVVKPVFSYLVVKGEDAEFTAMSKTVGLPLAIAAELVLTGKINSKGIQVPIKEEIYKPILSALETQGICLSEEEGQPIPG